MLDRKRARRDNQKRRLQAVNAFRVKCSSLDVSGGTVVGKYEGSEIKGCSGEIGGFRVEQRNV